MITRLTRIFLVIQSLLAISIAIGIDKLFQLNNFLVAVIIGITVVVLVRLLIITNNFHMSWYFHKKKIPELSGLGWQQVSRLFLNEIHATLVTSSFTMPFCSFKNYIASVPTSLPVLLIHGYACNSAYWQAMGKSLRRTNISHYAIDLEPITGGIDDYAPLIHDAIEILCAETNQDQAIIVAHSMGGLATRAYLRRYGKRRIAKVITLGTPHHGTKIANFGIGLNCREMQWFQNGEEAFSSEWLQTLKTSEEKDLYTLFVSIYSHHDNIVMPQTSAHLPGATNIGFYGIGHVALSLNPVVQACVIEEILNTPQTTSQDNYVLNRFNV